MSLFMKEFEHLKIKLEKVKRATRNFDKSRVIGSGGFGAVFKGEVSHGDHELLKGQTVVAIKRLNRKFGQGDCEFWKEIVMLSRYRHQNLISLLGFCDEGDEKILVYEHASSGSLDQRLGDPSLTWTQRLKICLGAAKGLSYLHDPNGSYQRVLHCDIKSSNILLDVNLNAKVADFGLAKIGPANQLYSVLLTNAVGTLGYTDPQYMTEYTLTKESDIYSFGVVLFEVMCGKLCYESSNGKLKVFVPMWKKCYTEKKLDTLIFQDLLKEMDSTSLETFSNIAFQCLHLNREKRPAMSLVIEKLELALESQKFGKEYEKILEAAVDPLVYRSVQELKVLLSKGLILNKGQTWFALNDKELHHVMISVDRLVSYKGGDYRSRYSHDYSSRFQMGTYNTCGKSFGIPGRDSDSLVLFEFLSPGITYMVNLVFKCPDIFKKKHKETYIALTYRLKGEEEKRTSIVHIGDKREDEWLMAGLYYFTTTNNNNQTINYKNLDLRIHFEDHEYWKGGLEIEGIEFQPLENVEFEDDGQVLIDEYQEILEASTYPPLIYRSVQELKLLLSRGVLLNRDKTWFYLNENGQHCEMISIEECLIPDVGIDYNYSSHWNSRFKAGSLNSWECKFRIRVRTQFLSPYITYSVYLVFKFHELFDKDDTIKQFPIGLKYKLDGETKTWISYHANKREDNWWMVELCQIMSDRKTFDLGISFEGFEYETWIIKEGIEFQPMKKAAKQQVLEAKIEKEADMQPPTYWEQKLPNNYLDIIKWSKDNLQWKTMKELYSIFCKGFLINNGQRSEEMQWLFLDKNGKRCHMLSAREGFEINENYPASWRSSPESRFGETLVLGSSNKYKVIIRNKIRGHLLSPRTTYACYLVYKLPEYQYNCKTPVKVSCYQDSSDHWYIYLVGPPEIPARIDQNNLNPLNRPTIKGIPQERSDGWMEVHVWEFQTATTTETIGMWLELTNKLQRFDMMFYGFIIQGIEFRPI